MIQGKKICKSFDGFKALNEASFHVQKGAVYGLVGPNGAGKSTLLRHITGVFRQDSGQILVDGEEVYENPAVKSKIAYIPDDMFYFRQSNIVDMKNYYKGIYPKFDDELFEKLFECFPSIDKKKNIRRMSKGMQKQTAFLLAIAMRPEILILDEPVDGLDPVMRRQIWSIILNAVSEEEMTVMVSSHNLRELEDVCDHVGIMNKGSIIIERSLSELQSSVSKVQIAFSGEVPSLEGELNIMNHTSMGKVQTLIIKGDQQEIKDKLKSYNPILMDMLPLTLEEIFIYELGGEDYGVKDIIL
ncbi:MAG: ABC transporter ATP-binding protein [Lachnospiraceae bacterium]|nr:ABC transporter ATP-binding protein [Lachnospiraceae bacterium]